MNNSFKQKDDVKTEFHTEPVAWWDGKEPSVVGLSYFESNRCPIPLYTHPHPDNLGLAESIIKQQELRIVELQAKIDEMAGEIMTLENRIGAMTGYGHN